jgi:hypothetical protein
MIDFYRDWRARPEEWIALGELTTEELQGRDIGICPAREDFGPVCPVRQLEPRSGIDPPRCRDSRA